MNLSQSTLITVALIAGFVAYLGMTGKLPKYWSLLTGGTAQSAPAGAAASGGSPAAAGTASTSPSAGSPSTSGGSTATTSSGGLFSVLPSVTVPGTSLKLHLWPLPSFTWGQ
jgi:hypothetical protein